MLFDEPEIQPDDTQPTSTMPVVNVDQGGGDEEPPHERPRIWGLLSLIGAFIFTLGTIVVLLMPQDAPAPPPSQQEPLENTAVAQGEALTLPAPTSTPQADAPEITALPLEAGYVLPTMSVEEVYALLGQPVSNLTQPDGQVERGASNPFTIIPDRPRNTIIEYVVEQGDTVFDIARKFNVTQDSIAWANDRTSLWTLAPGSVLKIPPVDGVVHIAVGDSTIADIAGLYQVEPTVIINSDANQLKGLDPSMVPPSGMSVFVPGAQGIPVNWSPPTVQTSGGSSGPGGGSAGTVSFEPGAPGSCAPMPPGAGTAWGSPMNAGSYTITRGYSDWHQGIDLAAPVGTPVFAANGGTVIFAGRSNWGYGLAVVISSGPFFTLYGHMSQVNVSCGQVVGTGQSIGAVGSTGNSSGPHLHFEILSGSFRTNPASTIAF